MRIAPTQNPILKDSRLCETVSQPLKWCLINRDPKIAVFLTKTSQGVDNYPCAGGQPIILISSKFRYACLKVDGTYTVTNERGEISDWRITNALLCFHLDAPGPTDEGMRALLPSQFSSFINSMSLSLIRSHLSGEIFPSKSNLWMKDKD